MVRHNVRRAWHELPDEELLDLRLRDLDVRVEGTWLVDMVDKLHEELAHRDLAFRPHCWLSSEWFSPDGVPGIAIPFYLAHKRLMRLERKHMLEVEGGTRDACMRILRHEAGHAIDTAFRLRRKRRWQQTFGRSTQPYPDTYRPNPYSRDHVLHLEWWYAQSHPLEDFAETFAVWLRPRSRWRTEYADWPARAKLEFVDELMRELAGKRPVVQSRRRVDPLSQQKSTLRRHYRKRQDHYGIRLSAAHHRDLRRLFAAAAPGDRRPTAAAFLRRQQREMREVVAHKTGQHPYAVDQFLNDMIARCRALNLRLPGSEEQAKLDAAVVLTVQVMRWVQRGGHRIAL